MKPSKANVKAHLEKIREIIKANKTAKQASLIRLLNPVLRGWANYHSHVVAKKAFDRVDHEVWSMLWRWAVRRHPKKGARWVKIKYFKTKGFPGLGIFRHRKKRGWHDKRGHLAQGIGYADKTAYQDQSGRQSVRSAMGAVLRIPKGQEDAELGTRSQ